MIKPHNQNSQDSAPVVALPALARTTTVGVADTPVVSHDTTNGWLTFLLVVAVVLIAVSAYKIIREW